jgi:CubicO group peptidase (beta-lactamase class C family)
MMVPKTVDDMVAGFRDKPLEFAPGEQFRYNNSGYFLLGVIIEKVAGRKYEQVLRDEIFAPLGMSDTGYDWSEPLLPRRASGYARRDEGLVNAPFLDMQQPYSAGSLYSTAAEMGPRPLHRPRAAEAGARDDVHPIQERLCLRLEHHA